MVTTRRATYPRGTYRFRPRALVKRPGPRRKFVVKRRRAVPRRGVKRRASGMMSQAKRQKTYRDANQYRQLQTLVSKRGRKTSAYVFMKSLVKASYDYSKFIIRGYALDGASGSGDTGGRFYKCGLEKPPGTLTFYPLYVLNLTKIPQAQVGGTVTPTTMWRLQGDTANPQRVYWVDALSLNNAGSSSTAQWYPYVSSASAVLDQVWPKALMEYVSIRATFRGPQTKPTRFIMEIVQPFAWFNGMPDDDRTGTDGEDALWQSEANRLSANMCQNVPNILKRPWRVLKTFVYELQPTSTTENDVAGHDVHQRHFWRCNKLLNYGNHGGVPSFPDTDGDYANLAIGGAEQAARNSVNAAPGTNVYLIIKAYSPVPATGFSAPVHPSFDLFVEKKVSHLAVNVGAT